MSKPSSSSDCVRWSTLFFLMNFTSLCFKTLMSSFCPSSKIDRSDFVVCGCFHRDYVPGYVDMNNAFYSVAATYLSPSRSHFLMPHYLVCFHQIVSCCVFWIKLHFLNLFISFVYLIYMCDVAPQSIINPFVFVLSGGILLSDLWQGAEGLGFEPKTPW